MDYDTFKYPMIWLRTGMGGYGFTARIPCRVVGTSARRVRVAALLKDGSERLQSVRVESLRHEPCDCFNECRDMAELRAKVS